MYIDMTTIQINNRSFYDAESLKEENPVYFYGTSRTIREIIKKKNIPKNDYIFATYSKVNGWKVSEDSVKKAKLLLKKEWVETFFYKKEERNKKEEKEEMKEKEAEKDEEEEKYEKAEKDEEAMKDEEEIKLEEESECEIAPDILELEENEKFMNADGNIIEIETRGEKHHEKIYFKVKDIENGFGLKNLEKLLFNENNGGGFRALRILNAGLA